ncbi:uncharacterized protein METZ01_LOCUS306343 [marine metagenome]|uniref:GST N-terminal domain-containing protein n=1 Tax=marine metagenome TaxID=408172 RepID=A0A382MX67_9ZZZZ
MIDLYYAPTPNGWKITIMLEECKLPYKIIPMNLGKGDQFEPHFLEISPNNRMPAIIDYQGLKGEKVSVFESGAILIYLAEKSGKFLSKEPLQRIKVLEWLFWQVGGLGPMAGQVSHFINYAPNFPGDHSYSENRYKNEYDRLLGVMNNILDQKEYLAGEYSIADMASFPWITAYKRYEVDLDKFKNVRRWFDDLKNRSAVRKGMDVGKLDRNFGQKPTEESLKMMFQQNSETITTARKKKEKK